MAYAYTLNCGQYVLTEDGRPIGRPLDEVAVCLSLDAGCLHKHGPKEAVEAWATKARGQYRSAGLQEMADDIVVLAGRLPLADLNKCLTHSDYAGSLYRKAVAGELSEEPLPAMVAPSSSSAPARPSSSRPR